MRFTPDYCSKYQHQHKLGYKCDNTTSIGGISTKYTGTMLLEEEGIFHFSETPCFAAWSDTFVDEDGEQCSRYDEDAYDTMELDEPHLEVTYEHKVDSLIWEETEWELLYRAGWDNVIQPVFSLMPKFDQLMLGHDLVFDTSKWSLTEANHNWRVVRSFHEHQQFVRSAGWAAHLFPDLLPPAQLTLASVYELGPYGFIKLHCGDPHTSLVLNMSFTEIAHTLRAFNYMYHNKGVLWGKEFADQDSRRFMGIDDEVQHDTQRRRPINYEGNGISNINCGPATGPSYKDHMNWKATQETATYIREVQKLHDGGEDDTTPLDITPALLPYNDQIRRTCKPW